MYMDRCTCGRLTDEADLVDCEGSGLKVCWNKVCPECRQMVEELATCPACAPVARQFHAEQVAKALIADALKSTAEIEADTRRARQARAELAEIGEWFKLAG